MLSEKCIMHTASIDIYGLMMRGYYFTSMCIIVISIFIFLWSFEKRKPKTREIVTLAVMTALAVVGRLAFFMTPQVKPCAAIIIITGVMLGRQSGFSYVEPLRLLYQDFSLGRAVDTVADDSLWHNRLFIRSFIFKKEHKVCLQ